MSITIENFEFRTRPMRTRFPFRYGIAAMTELPHVFLHITLDLNGEKIDGIASEGLPPKWFTKNPSTRFEEDLPQMYQVLEKAISFGLDQESESVFALWKKIYDCQDSWAKTEKVPPLLAHLGTSLVERAVIDAFCRGAGCTFSEALRNNQFGITLESIHSELRGSNPVEWLPKEPEKSIIARHTIGLGDALTADDIKKEELCDDGLPQALDDAIRYYSLTHFKVKLSGNLESDLPRLRGIAKTLRQLVPEFKFTLDGNEQYPNVMDFREHWERFLEDPILERFLSDSHLLFVEQPIHRDFALHESVRQEIESWESGPPMIIDESDGELDSLRRALELGYRGTSHKNCKGVFKGVANACLLEYLRREGTGPWILSGEDLANVGPVALLNDLAVMSSLGVQHVERNGHHYFSGLSVFPRSLQEDICAAHPDLYEWIDSGFASLVIKEGSILAESIISGPFGCAMVLSEKMLRNLGDPGLNSGQFSN